MVDDLRSCVLDFQSNMAKVMYRTKTTYVEPEAEESHAIALEYVWESSRLTPGVDEEGDEFKWRQLGFDSENLGREFADVGVLGLYCLVSLVPFPPLILAHF